MTDLTHIKISLLDAITNEGFQQARISSTDTSPYFEYFSKWVSDGFNGEMDYLKRNQDLREFPEKLHANTCRVISLRYDYLPENPNFNQVLENQDLANISRYALGRDYHKLMRKKLSRLCKNLSDICNDQNNTKLDYRVFVDSAPVLETSFAEKSGLGWKGKHTLVINKDAGSWFFLGEIFINLPLAIDEPVENLCKDCVACLSICPTQAIIAPYKVDARRCISYLTIENKSAIPIEFREMIGNRVYGCDDCQLVCPWNRYASSNVNNDFKSKNNLDSSSLLSLLAWNENTFLVSFEGSPIRRIGYQNWLRNLAVAIGNSPASKTNISALMDKQSDTNEMVSEHFDWAINLQSAHLIDDKREHKRNSKLIRTIKKLMPNHV
ncbi:MAG: tRNA epoxyqueuosine(34) reductase QueG [Gammaproteobacteria bacterium]|nr:MAG: tRNA epoxyqueuosine(34) reductase QueG [Gammaproteobacteria bacterium]